MTIYFLEMIKMRELRLETLKKKNYFKFIQ